MIMISETKVDDASVRTFRFGECYYRTVVSGGVHDRLTHIYLSRGQAEAGHAEVVRELRIESIDGGGSLAELSELCELTTGLRVTDPDSQGEDVWRASESEPCARCQTVTATAVVGVAWSESFERLCAACFRAELT